MGRNPNSIWISAVLCALILGATRRVDSESFIYKGCSQELYTDRSDYQNNLNSLLSSLLSQASTVGYYNASVGNGNDAVYGLYQCRGDLSNDDCSSCLRNAESQASQICINTRGARVQLEGCFLHYDRTNFFGQADTYLIYKICSPRTSTDADFSSQRNNVLTNLQAGNFDANGFRDTSSGDSRTGPLRGLAECEGDLSVSDCSACLTAAVQKLRDLCPTSVDGQVYLTKCYARYGPSVDYDGRSAYDNDDDDDAGKTIAIIIGLLAAVALAVVFLSFLRMLFRKQYGD